MIPEYEDGVTEKNNNMERLAIVNGGQVSDNNRTTATAIAILANWLVGWAIHGWMSGFIEISLFEGLLKNPKETHRWTKPFQFMNITNND